MISKRRRNRDNCDHTDLSFHRDDSDMKKYTHRNSHLSLKMTIKWKGVIILLSSLAILLIRPNSDTAINLMSSEVNHERVLRTKRNPENIEQKSRTCIIVALQSKSDEFDLRNWQRQDFKSQLSRYEQLFRESNAQLQQRFMIEANFNVDMNKIHKDEKRINGDVLFLKTQEVYDNNYNTPNTFDTFRQILPLLETPTCENSFLVHADNDFVINYSHLVNSILAMPKSSTYFGTMIPNTPIPNLSERTFVSFAYDVLPIWALGGLYGISVDVVRHLTKPEVEQTVLKKEGLYVFPQEDQAIGVALQRSNFEDQIKYIFTKAVFHHCPVETFSCEKYGHFMGFSVRSTLADKDRSKNELKLKSLDEISTYRDYCEQTIPQFDEKNYIFEIDEDFRKKQSNDYFFYGCTELNEAGRNKFMSQKKLSLEVHKTDVLGDIECADKVYREAFPDAKMEISSGKYVSGREHFLKVGHLDSSKHFFCPVSCKDQTDCCKKEQRYLDKHPDVKKSVQLGIFRSGLEHYNKYGHFYGSKNIYHDGCDGYEKIENDAKDKKSCYDSINTFIQKTEASVNKWPLFGTIPDEPFDPGTCKEVIFIEGKRTDRMDYVLRNHRRFTGPDWKFYLVGPSEVAKTWRQKFNGSMIEVVELPEKFEDFSDYQKQTNHILMSTYLWEDVIKCEHVLVTNTDAILFRHGIEDFMFKYAYVGGPVYSENHPTADWRVLNAINMTHHGGSGGLSLRRKSYMIKALKDCSIPKEGSIYSNEDSWYSACLMELGAPLPSTLVANRFSVGSKCEVDNPFGMHKLWQHCRESQCLSAIFSSSMFQNNLFTPSKSMTTSPCEEGERHYVPQIEGLASAIARGNYSSGFDHWKKHSEKSEIKYTCFDSNILEKGENRSSSLDDHDKK